MKKVILGLMLAAGIMSVSAQTTAKKVKHKKAKAKTTKTSTVTNSKAVQSAGSAATKVKDMMTPAK